MAKQCVHIQNYRRRQQQHDDARSSCGVIWTLTTVRSFAHVTRRDVTTWPQYRVTQHTHMVAHSFNVGIQQMSLKEQVCMPRKDGQVRVSTTLSALKSPVKSVLKRLSICL